MGWTREQLAEASSVSKMTLADFETEKRKPYDRTLRDIERAFASAGLVFSFGVDDSAAGRGVTFATTYAPDEKAPLQE